VRVSAQRPPASRFVPRASLAIGGGVALFFLTSMLYTLPVWTAPAPPDAPENYIEQRVQERLRGKVLWFLVPSLIVAAAVTARFSRK
jgi:hypothetical protein